jgi:alpha-L-rhamnosidase
VITALRLRAEYRTDSEWVAEARPRLSWIAETDDPGWTQTAAEIRLDDGRVAVLEGADHVFVAWPFEALAPRQEVAARVRLRDADGTWSDPSEPCRIRLGALGESEWRARLIGLADPTADAQPFVARRTIRVERPLASATLYWTALGAATVRIDGQPVDDTVLSPGWTSYADRLLHESVDVTSLLTPGVHVLGAR